MNIVNVLLFNLLIYFVLYELIGFLGFDSRIIEDASSVRITWCKGLGLVLIYGEGSGGRVW